MYGKLVVLFYLVVASSALDYDDCGSTAIINSVTFDGCTAQPCTMVKGQNYNLNVTGVTTTASSSLPAVVSLDVLGIQIPVLTEDSCGNMLTPCPLGASVPFAYTRVMNVSPSMPGTFDTVTSALVENQDGNAVFCAKLEVRIRNP